MKYGLIGEKLSHSFSKEIHGLLADYDYELCEMNGSELKRFFEKRDFCGVNVTIPFKQRVIKYLDYIDDAAKSVGAVNTVVNKDDKLYGYNTDVFGLAALVKKCGVDFTDKKVLILGGGGTSKTALYVAEKSGAGSVFRVSRTEKDGFITYRQATENHTDAEIIINTTPVGMYPENASAPIDTSRFKNLNSVLDVIYNPLKSRLVLAALRRGITAAGGLYMLVMQACRSAELFTEKKISIRKAESIYRSVLRDKQNIVLVGMPSAGKTEVGKRLSAMLNMPFFDSDEEIKKRTGRTPADIINTDTEAVFREIESETLYELSLKNHIIIATGGGAVTREENMINLKANGKIYYIDRPLDLLVSSPDRPLSSSKPAIAALYNARKTLYENAADKTVKNDTDLDSVAKIMKKDFLL